MGLWKNFEKAIRLLCSPWHAVGTQTEGSYDQWVTGGGFTYWARKRIRVKCPDYGVYLATGCLEVY